MRGKQDNKKQIHACIYNLVFVTFHFFSSAASPVIGQPVDINLPGRGSSNARRQSLLEKGINAFSTGSSTTDPGNVPKRRWNSSIKKVMLKNAVENIKNILRGQGNSPISRDNQTVSPAVSPRIESPDHLPHSFSSKAPPSESLKKPAAIVPSSVASAVVAADEDRK